MPAGAVRVGGAHLEDHVVPLLGARAEYNSAISLDKIYGIEQAVDDALALELGVVSGMQDTVMSRQTKK